MRNCPVLTVFLIISVLSGKYVMDYMKLRNPPQYRSCVIFPLFVRYASEGTLQI